MDETPLQKWQREEAAQKEQFRLADPNHRVITRGPRKGQVVRLTRAERSKARRIQAERQILLKAEAVLNPPPVASVSPKASAPSRTKEPTDYSNVLMVLLIFALPVASYFAVLEIAKGLTFINLLPLLYPLIIGDFIAWRLISRAKPRTKYLPVLWWIFGRA